MLIKRKTTLTLFKSFINTNSKDKAPSANPIFIFINTNPKGKTVSTSSIFTFINTNPKDKAPSTSPIFTFIINTIRKNKDNI